MINGSNVHAYTTQDEFDDTYFNMELDIQRYGDGLDFTKVTKCLRDKDGLPIGRAHNNPILDTIIC